MKQNPDFTLIKLGSNYHIIPIGQALASNHRGIRITESGVHIWSLFTDDLTIDECIQRYIAESEIPFEYIENAKADARSFIDIMIKCNLIITSGTNNPSYSDRISGIDTFLHCNETLSSTISIANINIGLYGPIDAIDDKLLSFESLSNIIDQAVYIHLDNVNKEFDTYLQSIKNLAPSIHNSTIDIYNFADGLLFIFPSTSLLDCMWIDSSYKKIHIVCNKKVHEISLLKDEIFHAFRMPFLMLARTNGLYAIHSASVLYQNKAILFSALSGTGKSTQAKHWTNGLFATDINGDVNLIGMNGNIPTVYGIPWCGTSDIYTTESHELGHIVYIKRSTTNHVEYLDENEGLLTLSKRNITLMLTADHIHQFFSDMKQLCKKISFCELHCTQEADSQKVLQQFIDECP